MRDKKKVNTIRLIQDIYSLSLCVCAGLNEQVAGLRYTFLQLESQLKNMKTKTLQDKELSLKEVSKIKEIKLKAYYVHFR